MNEFTPRSTKNVQHIGSYRVLAVHAYNVGFALTVLIWAISTGIMASLIRAIASTPMLLPLQPEWTMVFWIGALGLLAKCIVNFVLTLVSVITTAINRRHPATTHQIRTMREEILGDIREDVTMGTVAVIYLLLFVRLAISYMAMLTKSSWLTWGKTHMVSIQPWLTIGAALAVIAVATGVRNKLFQYAYHEDGE